MESLEVKDNRIEKMIIDMIDAHIEYYNKKKEYNREGYYNKKESDKELNNLFNLCLNEYNKKVTELAKYIVSSIENNIITYDITIEKDINWKYFNEVIIKLLKEIIKFEVLPLPNPRGISDRLNSQIDIIFGKELTQ
jgi:hypothetical protein